jgi:hypothetical protein
VQRSRFDLNSLKGEEKKISQKATRKKEEKNREV